MYAQQNYDAAGNLASVYIVPPGGSSTPVTWIANGPFFGPIRFMTWGNEVQDQLTLDLDYRPTTFQLTATSGYLTNQTYGCDAANNLKTVTDTVNAFNNQTLGYDVLNRLNSAVSGTGGYGSLGWTYDKNGNLKTATIGSSTTTYTYATTSNQLVSYKLGTVTTTVSTNANGNITSIPPANSTTAATFGYNVANRLSSVTGSPTAITSIVYDGFGNRFSKQDPGSTPTYYTYDLHGNLLEENNSGSLTDYIYIGNRLVGIFVPSTSALYYVHGDRQGTPQMVTNSSQAVVWSTTYQPYGTTTTPISSITQNVRFPGQYSDLETGFYYNMNRDYMPNLGRYLESDPIGLRGGLNTYRYASANPGRFTDRWGFAPNDPDNDNPQNGSQLPICRANQIIAPAIMGDLLDPTSPPPPSVLNAAEEMFVTGGADVVAAVTYNDLLPGGAQQADADFDSGVTGSVLSWWFNVQPPQPTAIPPISLEQYERTNGGSYADEQ